MMSKFESSIDIVQLSSYYCVLAQKAMDFDFSGISLDMLEGAHSREVVSSSILQHTEEKAKTLDYDAIEAMNLLPPELLSFFKTDDCDKGALPLQVSGLNVNLWVTLPIDLDLWLQEPILWLQRGCTWEHPRTDQDCTLKSSYRPGSSWIHTQKQIYLWWLLVPCTLCIWYSYTSVMHFLLC